MDVQQRVSDETGIDDRGRVSRDKKCSRLPGEVVTPTIAVIVRSFDRFQQIHQVLGAFGMVSTLLFIGRDGIQFGVTPEEQAQSLGVMPFGDQEQGTQIPGKFLDALCDRDARIFQTKSCQSQQRTVKRVIWIVTTVVAIIAVLQQ